MITPPPHSIWPRAATGSFAGAAIGVVASFAPVSHWEMANLFVIASSTGAGLVGGAFSARRGLVDWWGHSASEFSSRLLRLPLRRSVVLRSVCGSSARG